MTLIRSKRENITILDFSSGKLSKNKIKHSLRNAKIEEVYNNETKTLTIFDNYIKVGMYSIKLVLHEDYKPNNLSRRLKDFGFFQINILESNKPINLPKDKRFKDQYWVKQNKKNNLRIANLIDIVYYCYRLNKLRLFL